MLVGGETEAKVGAEAHIQVGLRFGGGRIEVVKVRLEVRVHGEFIEVRWEAERGDGQFVEVRHTSEDEVEWCCLGSAVELRFDLLGVCVRGKLLAGALHQQEKGIVLRVGDFELFSADLTDFICGGVRAHHQRFGCAAAVKLLQCHPQVVLEVIHGRCRPGGTPAVPLVESVACL